MRMKNKSSVKCFLKMLKYLLHKVDSSFSDYQSQLQLLLIIAQVVHYITQNENIQI